jgi:hypothetical protein
MYHYINTLSNVKFSLYLKKAGLASQNIVQLVKKSSYVVSVSAFVFFMIIVTAGRKTLI